MSRGKWIIAFLCVPAALLGAALLQVRGICPGGCRRKAPSSKAVLTGQLFTG